MKKEIVQEDDGYYVRITCDDGRVMLCHPKDADEIVAQLTNNDQQGAT